MPEKAFLIRNGNAANDKLAPLRQLMDIEALSYSEFAHVFLSQLYTTSVNTLFHSHHKGISLLKRSPFIGLRNHYRNSHSRGVVQRFLNISSANARSCG